MEQKFETTPQILPTASPEEIKRLNSITFEEFDKNREAITKEIGDIADSLLRQDISDENFLRILYLAIRRELKKIDDEDELNFMWDSVEEYLLIKAYRELRKQPK